MKKLKNIKLKHSFHSLSEIGIATQYFPEYVNTVPAPHSVDIVLLSFIVKGNGYHIMDDERFYESGTSLGITHYGQTHTIITDSDGMEIMNIYLDLESHPLPVLPGPLNGVLPDILPLHPCLRNRLNRVVRLTFSNPSTVTQLVFNMDRELSERKSGYQSAVIEYFKLFLIECCREVIDSGIRPSSELINSQPHPLEQFRRFIDYNFKKNYSLEELAKRAGYSRNYLCRIFKKYTGKTLFNYLIERRVQAAMLKLRTGQEKIFNVAVDCGFEDLSYFNRVFKRLTGVSPGKYRSRWFASDEYS